MDSTLRLQLINYYNLMCVCHSGRDKMWPQIGFWLPLE